MKFEEGDVVICKVVRIDEASVFLDVEGEFKGSMFMPEVAAGRIRNLRDYVNVGRVVVCKVLKVYPDHLELSLRRVSAKERERALERYKREKRLEKILELASLDAKKIMKKMKQREDYEEFFYEIWSKPELLEEYAPASKLAQLSQAVMQKAEKEKVLRRKIKLHSLAEDGVERIKQLLLSSSLSINYAGSGNFILTATGDNLKEIDQMLEREIEEMRKRASKLNVQFEIIKERASRRD